MESKNITLYLENFDCVRVFKSVRRAIRRGHMTITGMIAPRRPFNNRKGTRGRELNELKKKIYYGFTSSTGKGTEEEGVQQ